MDDFIVDTLATHRLTRLVVEDEITAPIRKKIFEKFGDPSENRLAYLVTCPHCSSIWIGLGVVAARTIAPKVWRPLAYALAYSSITGWVEEHS